MNTSVGTALSYQYYRTNIEHLSVLARGGTDQQHASHLPGTISEEQRWKAISHMLETGFKVGVGSKAGQLACLYFDEFCAKWTEVVVELLSAVALTALMIAAKLDGTVVLTPDWVSQQSGSTLSTANILDLEVLILHILDWDLDLPTASELSRFLLSFSAPGYDFTELMEAGDCYASLCYSLRSLTAYGAEAIALASICCVLEQRGQTEFRDQWMDKVGSVTKVGRDTVRELSGRIHGRLQALYGSDEETDCGSPGLERSSEGIVDV